MAFLGLCLHHSSFCLCLHRVVFPVRAPLLIRTPVTGLRARSNPIPSNLNLMYILHVNLHLQRLYLQISSCSQVLGIRTSTYLFFLVGGDTIQLISPQQSLPPSIRDLV